MVEVFRNLTSEISKRMLCRWNRVSCFRIIGIGFVVVLELGIKSHCCGICVLTQEKLAEYVREPVPQEWNPVPISLECRVRGRKFVELGSPSMETGSHM